MRKVSYNNGTVTRHILIGMITDPVVIARIASRWDKGMFTSKPDNLIAKWCVDHWNTYKKPIGKDITIRFQSWASSKTQDDTTVKSVERFLSFLSDEHDKQPTADPDFLIDQAGELFNQIQLKALAQSIEDRLQRGEVAKADELTRAYKRVELGVGSCVDMLTDPEFIESAFEETATETLIKYPGALGKFFRGQLCRDGFIGLMAPQKAGKSFFLLDMAWNAILQGKRVAYFQVGDMTPRQVARRWAIRTSGHPLKSPDGWPLVIQIPESIERPDEIGCAPHIEYEERTFHGPLTVREAWNANKKLSKKGGQEASAKFHHFPTLGVSIDGIYSIIRSWWDESSWKPDVVVIDYADNLAPLSMKIEARDNINLTWSKMKAMVEEFHVLLLTATQVNAASYGTTWLSRRNFSADNRKLNHVTGMIGINVSADEKAVGACRLNWVVLREDDFTQFSGPSIAGCLAIAQPVVCSVW